MLRVSFRRWFGLLSVLLLLQGSSADALALHTCAHHDALPSSQPAEHAHHHGESAPADEPDAGCTCIGECSITGAALVAAPVTASVDVVSTAYPVSSPAAERILPPAAPFSLPYSTAPPAAL
jgi:hypothetical protein